MHSFSAMAQAPSPHTAAAANPAAKSTEVRIASNRIVLLNAKERCFPVRRGQRPITDIIEGRLAGCNIQLALWRQASIDWVANLSGFGP